MTSLPLFPLSLGGFDFLHASGAVGAVFSPVGFGDKGRAADGAPFPAPPVQEGCGQLPVKGQDSHTEPAAHEGIGNALDAHARLPVVQKQAVSPVIITALMHKAAGCPVLPVVHAGRLIVHGSIPLSGQAPDFSGRFLSCASALLWLSALWLRLSGGG